jgi:hypothetical protein
MKHLSHCLSALTLVALTGCAGLTTLASGSIISNTTYVFNVNSASAPTLRCPPYALPTQLSVPAVPLAAYSAIKLNDTKAYNALTLGYIEELRRYISESRKRNADSLVTYNLQCN